MFITKCWGTRLRQSLMLLLFFAVGNFGVLHAGEPKPQPKALLDQIWPYQSGSKPYIRPLSKQDQEYAEAALIQWLEAYLHHEYKVVDERFFWDARKNSNWGPIALGHASYIEDEKREWRGVEIEQPWHSPGFDGVRLWKVNIEGKDNYFVVASTKKPVPGTHGRRLIARFQLEKLIK
jgi:hypothetical protein